MTNEKVKNNINYKKQYFVILLTEIILEILKYLHPKILILLLQVNKRFNQLLSEESNIIFQLWKNSRLVFLEKRLLSPPQNLNEKQYIQFLINERCCNCKKKYSICSWKSVLKICKKCADKKNKKIIDKYFADYKFFNKYYTIDIIEEILNRKDCFAWKDIIEEIRKLVIKNIYTIEEITYTEIPNFSKHIKNKKYKDLYKFIKEREEEDKINEKYKNVKRKIEINKKINEMCLEKDENNYYKYQKYCLQECKSLILAYKYKTDFNEKSWKILKEKIIEEYNEILDKYKIKIDEKNNRITELKEINSNNFILKDIYQEYKKDYEEYKISINRELKSYNIKFMFDIYSSLFRYSNFIFPTVFDYNILIYYSNIIELQYDKIISINI